MECSFVWFVCFFVGSLFVLLYVCFDSFVVVCWLRLFVLLFVFRFLTVLLLFSLCVLLFVCFVLIVVCWFRLFCWVSWGASGCVVGLFVWFIC